MFVVTFAAVERQTSLESPPIVSHLSLNETTSQSPFKPVETQVATPVKQALTTQASQETSQVESMEVDPQNVKRKLTNQVERAKCVIGYHGNRKLSCIHRQ